MYKHCLTLVGAVIVALVVGLTALPPPEAASARETKKDTSAVSIVPIQGFWGGLWQGVKDMGSTVAEASEENVGGRTPVPDCHGDAERMPSGGEVNMEFHNGVLAWACVDSDGEYVTVKLTNTFTAPLTVASDPAATLQHPGIGISDALLVRIGESWGHDVLPVKGRGELEFPVESLPVTIVLGSDHEVVLSGIFATALDLAAEISSARDIQKILNSKEGIECLTSVFEEDYIGAIPCGLLVGEAVGTKAAAAVLGLVLATIDFGPTVIGQFIQDWKGPSSIALNYESSERPESGDKPDPEPCAGAAEQLAAERPNVQDGVFESYLNFVSDVDGCLSFEGTYFVDGLSVTVYDPDTGEELGILKDLDPDLTGGDFSVAYEEFCGAFGAFPARFGETGQEYFEQEANDKERAILDPDGDGLACSPEGGENSNEEANIEQAVEDYYLAAGAEEWGYTFDHLASETRGMFTEDEWFEKNQWLWDRDPLIYHINSINPDGPSSAEVELRITDEEDSSWTQTAFFIFEDGEWRHQFSEAETDLFMPGVPFDEFVEANGGGDTSDGGGEVCAGVSDCEFVDTADVDGDGVLDEVALVGEPEEYAAGRTPFTVRVLLAGGTALTYDTEIEFWGRDTAWHGATDFGQSPGEEIVIGGTSGAHTLFFRVLTYRSGELGELPYPDAANRGLDSFYGTLWPIDSALSVYMGVECQSDEVVLRSVSSVGAPGDDVPFEGEETTWILDGDQWQMIDSSDLYFPDYEGASEIHGWQCGDLPRGYD